MTRLAYVLAGPSFFTKEIKNTHKLQKPPYTREYCNANRKEQSESHKISTIWMPC